jgi:hypothetical protein
VGTTADLLAAVPSLFNISQPVMVKDRLEALAGPLGIKWVAATCAAAEPAFSRCEGRKTAGGFGGAGASRLCQPLPTPAARRTGQLAAMLGRQPMLWSVKPGQVQGRIDQLAGWLGCSKVRHWGKVRDCLVCRGH